MGERGQACGARLCRWTGLGVTPSPATRHLHGLGQGASGSEPRFPLLCNGLIVAWRDVGDVRDDGCRPQAQWWRMGFRRRGRRVRQRGPLPLGVHRDPEGRLGRLKSCVRRDSTYLLEVACLPFQKAPSATKPSSAAPRPALWPCPVVPTVTCLAPPLNGALGPACPMGPQCWGCTGLPACRPPGCRPSEPSWRARVGCRVVGGGVVGRVGPQRGVA